MVFIPRVEKTITEVERDKQGRVTRVIRKDYFSGHSVCHKCGKDMPAVWDTVCYKCNYTFCTNCTKEKNGKWICNECQ